MMVFLLSFLSLIPVDVGMVEFMGTSSFKTLAYVDLFDYSFFLR